MSAVLPRESSSCRLLLVPSPLPRLSGPQGSPLERGSGRGSGTFQGAGAGSFQGVVWLER